jgi:antitoxin HicB
MTSKDLNYYLSLPYTILVEPDKENGGYVAWIRELRGCITQAETWEEIGMMIEDAKRGWLEVALEHGDEIPEPLGEQIAV